MISYEEWMALPYVLRLLVDNWFLPLSYPVENVRKEIESADYQAYQFQLNGKNMLFRYAKITPKRVGHFVTLWQRPTPQSEIIPFDKNDGIDWVIIVVKEEYNEGFFLFDIDTLVKKGIFSTDLQGGKRAIRVYAPWTKPTSKQAIKTQQWQIQHFINASDNTAIEKFKQRIGESIDRDLLKRLEANRKPLEFPEIDLSQFSEQLRKEMEGKVIWADDFETIEDVTKFLDSLENNQ